MWEIKYLQCCVHSTRPGRSHSLMRLHNFLCLSPLKMNSIPYNCAEYLKNRIDHNLTASKYIEFSVGSWSIYNFSLEPCHYSDEQYVCVKGPEKRSSCDLSILKGRSWVWLHVSTLLLSALLAVIHQWSSWMPLFITHRFCLKWLTLLSCSIVTFWLGCDSVPTVCMQS